MMLSSGGAGHAAERNRPLMTLGARLCNTRTNQNIIFRPYVHLRPVLEAQPYPGCAFPIYSVTMRHCAVQRNDQVRASLVCMGEIID